MLAPLANPIMNHAPPAPPDQWRDAAVHFQIPGRIDHIDDPTGENRRLFECWASVEGLDYGSRDPKTGEWHLEDVPSESLRHAIANYVQKNNTFVWDHARHMPIGRILDWSVHPGVGVYVQGEIFRPEDIVGTGTESNPIPAVDLPDESLAWLAQVAQNNNFYDMEKMLNTVWGLMVQGHVRGVSWQGYTLKQWAWSEQLNKHVKQHALTLNILDFCITPIQVGQGAQIVRINKQAKALPLKEALRVAKALPLRPACTNTGDRSMSEKLQGVEAGFDDLLAQIHELDDDVQFSPEFLSKVEQTAKALGISTGLPSSNPNADRIATLEAELASLRGEAAPVRNRVSHAPTGGPAPRPGSQPDNVFELAAKAVEIGSTVRNGRTNFGQGEFISLSEEAVNIDTYKLHCVATEAYAWRHTQLGDAGKRLMQLARENHSANLPDLLKQQQMSV